MPVYVSIAIGYCKSIWCFLTTFRLSHRILRLDSSLFWRNLWTLKSPCAFLSSGPHLLRSICLAKAHKQVTVWKEAHPCCKPSAYYLKAQPLPTNLRKKRRETWEAERLWGSSVAGQEQVSSAAVWRSATRLMSGGEERLSVLLQRLGGGWGPSNTAAQDPSVLPGAVPPPTQEFGIKDGD